MAQPLQYQSQFVPTDFGTVGNVLGMFRQDMNQRNQEFDQGVAMEVQSLADLGALEAFDQEGKKQRIDSISKLMQEAVTKHGGDYGAASKDIARIIASERANPWYQFNKEQQEALKNYNQLKLNADNVIIGDPRVKYQDYQRGMAEGKNPFQVSALSKTNLYNQVSKIASNFADRLESDPKFKSTLGGQYFQAMKNYGISPENFEAFINTGEGVNIMKSVLAANPELQGANVDTVKEVGKQGLYSAIGKSDSQYLANQGYVSPYDAYRMRGEQSTPTGIGTGYTTDPEIQSRVDNRVRKDAEDIGLLYDEKGNVKEPSKKTIQITSVPGTGGGGAFTTEMSNQSSKAWDTFNKYKDTYSALYDTYKKQGKSDREFADRALELSRNEAYVSENYQRINNINFSENLSRLTVNPEKMFLDEDGDEFSYTKYNKKFKDADLKPGDLSTFISPKGEIKVIDPKGNYYSLNKKYQSNSMKHFTNLLETTYTDFYNYKVSKGDVAKINKNVKHLADNRYVGVYINPDNPEQRAIVAYTTDADGKLVPYARMNDFSELHNNILPILEQDLQSTLRKPKAEDE